MIKNITDFFSTNQRALMKKKTIKKKQTRTIFLSIKYYCENSQFVIQQLPYQSYQMSHQKLKISDLQGRFYKSKIFSNIPEIIFFNGYKIRRNVLILIDKF